MDKLEIIRETILSSAEKFGVEIDRIILFGSRAKGSFREGSDWDILVVTKKRLNRNLMKNFLSEVRWILVNEDIVPEIVVVDRDRLEKYKHLTGFVFYWAEKEGIVIA